MTREQLKTHRRGERECGKLHRELLRLRKARPRTPERIRQTEQLRQEAEEKFSQTLAQMMEELTHLEEEMEEGLERPEVRGRTVLRAYYVEGLLWREMPAVLGFHRSHLYRIYTDALNRLEEKNAAESVDSAAGVADGDGVTADRTGG